MESMQKELSRLRKPRIQIVYDVETEGAVVQRELPFVVGVIGDFSGNASPATKALRDRKFVQIDRDNFNAVMAHISPALDLKVENTLAGDGSEMAISLKFHSIEDFEPGNIVDQIQPLKDLLDVRNKIRDLMAKADRSDELETILIDVLQDETKIQGMATDLGIELNKEAK
jgi:type VI secretion system protein ImpB